MPPSAPSSRAEGSFISAIWSACALLGLAGIAGMVHSAFVPVPLRLVAPASSSDRTGQASGAAAGPGASAQTPRAGNQTGNQSGSGASENSGDAVETAAPLPEGRITLAQAFEQWELGTFFLDARNAAAYTAGHIEGAIHLSTEMLRRTGEGIALVQSLPPDAPVVVYCTGGDCHDAESVAIELQQIHGFTNVVVMQAGFDEWAAAGHPVNTGETP